MAQMRGGRGGGEGGEGRWEEGEEKLAGARVKGCTWYSAKVAT